MRLRDACYYQHQNRRSTPRAVGTALAETAGLAHDEPTRQYGRPATFFPLLQRLNLAAAWSTVDAPMLALWGKDDWIMSRSDIPALPTFLRSAHRAYNRFVELAQTDHILNAFAYAVDACRGAG